MSGIIKKAREEKAITQAELAGLLGISQRAVAYYEAGERRPPVPMAKRIGAALGFDWTELYDEEDGGDDIRGEAQGGSAAG